MSGTEDKMPKECSAFHALSAALCCFYQRKSFFGVKVGVAWRCDVRISKPFGAPKDAGFLGGPRGSLHFANSIWSDGFFWLFPHQESRIRLTRENEGSSSMFGTKLCRL